MRGSDRGVVLGLHRTRLTRGLLESALALGITRLDTATNYAEFGAHRNLAAIAGDILPGFSVSTKVGYFPAVGGAGTVHDLDAERLRRAAQRAADELRQQPDVVFLHNPERSLAGLDAADAQDRLADACAALEHEAQSGCCRAWGIATWDADVVRSAVAGAHVSTLAAPSVLMVRAGLLVRPSVLTAACKLGDALRLRESERWGMSPFGGDANASVWTRVDPRTLLMPEQPCSRWQAAFRVAYELPGVGSVAVGTSDPAHLRELAAARALHIDPDQLARYRRLLTATAAS